MAFTIAAAKSVTNLKITVNNSETNYSELFTKNDFCDVFIYKESNPDLETQNTYRN